MSIGSISKHVFAVELEWFFNVVNTHVDFLGWTVASHHTRIPMIAKPMGHEIMPFHFASDLVTVFEFGKGEKDVLSDHIYNVLEVVWELLFSSPASRATGETPKPDWDFLSERAFGTAMRAALARARLNDGEWITVKELQALTGLTASRIKRAGIEQKKIGGRVCCDPEGVRQALKRFA